MTGSGRTQILVFLGLLAVIYLARRLRELAEGRRLWRGGDDPDFQGDGWRWTVCLLLPNVLLWRSPKLNDLWAGCPVPGPFTFDMLVLTRAQRRACFDEWWATQQWYAAEERRLRAEQEGEAP